MHVSGTLAKFQMPRSHNWFHWLLQVLPKVKQLVDNGEPFDALHAPHMGCVHRQSLEAAMRSLGISVSVYEDEEVSADKTIQAPPFAWDAEGRPPRWLIEFVRGLAPLSHAVGHKRIFITRHGYADHDEAEEIERLLGFIIPVIDTSGMSFQKQVETFAAADLVVAPHGSGLTNIVFCRPGTKVVEIVPPKYTTNVFAQIAYATGCFYTRIQAVGGAGR
jgi:capsular polysaccharide biosynthesis protein